MGLARLADDQGRQLKTAERFLITYSMLAYQVHNHAAHVASKLWTAVADGASVIMYGEVPNLNRAANFDIDVGGEGAWHLKIFENVTMTNRGRKEVARDMYRKNPVDDLADVWTDGTVGTFGNKLMEKLIGGGINAIGSGSEAVSAWHVPAGSNLLIRMTNASGGAADCSIVATGMLEIE